MLRNQIEPDCIHDEGADGGDVADYPTSSFSKREIRAAGVGLRQHLPYTEDAVAMFRIAHNWRMAHAYPMLRERVTLARVVGDGGDTAGRIKRMDSIRKKLRRSGIGLDQMQDLAGVRAIVNDMNAVHRVVAWYSDRGRIEHLRRADDYIANPKRGGYRSVHLIRAYHGAGDAWRGHKVEIQIRTRLQHVWATAVEAVGAMRGEDLKAGEGDEKWLRLLELMSAYFATMEATPVGDHVPQDRRGIIAELRSIEADLSAITALSAFRAVVHGAEGATSRYFLVRLDAGRGEVSIIPQQNLLSGGEGYFGSADEGERIQTVMVAVDSLAALRRAYPNYFLDIGHFVGHLRDALGKLTMVERIKMGLQRW